jgi:hypothetical protein
MNTKDVGKIKKFVGDWELEVFYTCYYAELNTATKKFVDKFSTWPKENQDKIRIIKKNDNRRYMVIYDSIQVSKYNGPIIDYLNYHLEDDKIVEFEKVINYLKTYQYVTKPQNRIICTMIRPF